MLLSLKSLSLFGWFASLLAYPYRLFVERLSIRWLYSCSYILSFTLSFSGTTKLSLMMTYYLFPYIDFLAELDDIYYCLSYFIYLSLVKSSLIYYSYLCILSSSFSSSILFLIIFSFLHPKKCLHIFRITFLLLQLLVQSLPPFFSL